LTIDIGNLFSNNELPPSNRPVDDSGRPCPTRAWVTLSSGVVVECPIIYGGMFRNERRYRVVAEVDWATAKVATVDVDRWPPDVYVTLKIPDDWDDLRANEFGHDIEWKVAGQLYSPQRMIREGDHGR